MSRSSVWGAALVVALASVACGKSASGPVAPAASTSPAPAGESTPPRLTPEEVVARVTARYPERLVAGISHEARLANMEFLRDRIIETGICGGLNLAWNRKQNGLRSIDAIDWRHGEADINDVVDLALDYDNTDRELALHWHVTEGPATWDPYPTPTCANE